MNQLLDKDLLAKALHKAKRGKSKRRNVIQIMKDPQAAIDGVYELLRTGTYRTSNFHTKLINEPKLRIIYALPFYPDRIIHHAIMLVLEPIWDKLMYYHSYACRMGKGQHAASYQCLKWAKCYSYCAQLDISQFYINVDHDIMKSVIRQKIKDKAMLAILDENIDAIDIRANNIEIYKACLEQHTSVEQASVGLKKLTTTREMNDNRPAGVAVGSLTSQWFGNLYMNGLDTYITDTLGHRPYIRFCDDFVLFSNDKFYLHDIIEKIKEYMWKARRLILSKSRIFPTYHGVDFCGYRHFNNGVILLRKRTAKATRQRMNSLMHDLKRGFLTKESAISTIASAAGWLKHAMTYHLCDELGLDTLLKEVESYEEAVS